jgi:hypothetical protein
LRVLSWCELFTIHIAAGLTENSSSGCVQSGGGDFERLITEIRRLNTSSEAAAHLIKYAKESLKEYFFKMALYKIHQP